MGSPLWSLLPSAALPGTRPSGESGWPESTAAALLRDLAVELDEPEGVSGRGPEMRRKRHVKELQSWNAMQARKR